MTSSAVELPVELEDPTEKQARFTAKAAAANSSHPTVIHYCNEKESQEVLARAATYAQDRIARLTRTQAGSDRLFRDSSSTNTDTQERLTRRSYEMPRRSDNPRIHYCNEEDSQEILARAERLRSARSIDRCVQCRAANHLDTESQLATFELTRIELQQTRSESKHQYTRLETDELQAKTECGMCFEEERDAMVFPCLHVSCCCKCSAALGKCPHCGGEVTGIAHTKDDTRVIIVNALGFS